MSFSPFSFSPQGTGSSAAIVTTYTNTSSSVAIPQAQAVSVIDSSGALNPTDVSSSVSSKGMVGFANVRIEASGTGAVVSTGRLKNFTTALPVGTALYVGTDSNPTATVPSDGVSGFTSGDAVIFIGIVVKNEDNSSNKDIQLMPQVVGYL